MIAPECTGLCPRVQEAITWAWECLTQEYGLDPSRMYATYFGGDPNDPSVPVDAEARDLWLQFLPPERVIPSGAKVPPSTHAVACSTGVLCHCAKDKGLLNDEAMRRCCSVKGMTVSIGAPSGCVDLG